MKVFIKNITGKVCEIEIDASCSVHDLKDKLNEQHALWPSNLMKLIFRGRILADEELLNATVNYAEADVIYSTFPISLPLGQEQSSPMSLMRAQLLQLLQEAEFLIDDPEQSVLEVIIALSRARQNLEEKMSDREMRRLRTEVDNLERIVDLYATIYAAAQSGSSDFVVNSFSYRNLCDERKILEKSLHKSYSEYRRNACCAELRQNILNTLEVLFARRDLLQACASISLGSSSVEELIDEAKCALIAIDDGFSHRCELPMSMSRNSKFASASSDIRRWETFASICNRSSHRIVAIVEQSFNALHLAILRDKGILGIVGPTQDTSEPLRFVPQFCSTYEEFVQDEMHFFAFHAIMCHASFERDKLCKETYDKLWPRLGKFPMSWNNSNSLHWFNSERGPLEMAKLYCRSLGAHAAEIRQFDDFNTVSLLRIMMRCSFFCSPSPIPNPSGILECISKRDTVHGCLEAVKHWASFGKAGNIYSEEDFSGAFIFFQDLNKQLQIFDEMSSEYLQKTVHYYFETPFKFTDHHSYVSGQESESTFPVLCSSSRSVGSSGIDDDYQNIPFDALDREHQLEHLKVHDLEISQAHSKKLLEAASAVVQQPFRNELAGKHVPSHIETGQLWLDLCTDGIRPFIHMVLSQLQHKTRKQFQSPVHVSDFDHRNSVVSAFLGSRSFSADNRHHPFRFENFSEGILEPNALDKVANLFVNDSSGVHYHVDILDHGDIDVLLQIIVNCTEFGTFACCCESPEDQKLLQARIGREIDILFTSSKFILRAKEIIDHADDFHDFSETDCCSAEVAAKALLSSIVAVSYHFERFGWSVASITSAKTALDQANHESARLKSATHFNAPYQAYERCFLVIPADCAVERVKSARDDRLNDIQIKKARFVGRVAQPGMCFAVLWKEHIVAMDRFECSAIYAGCVLEEIAPSDQDPPAFVKIANVQECVGLADHFDVLVQVQKVRLLPPPHAFGDVKIDEKIVPMMEEKDFLYWQRLELAPAECDGWSEAQLQAWFDTRRTVR